MKKEYWIKATIETIILIGGGALLGHIIGKFL